MATSELQKSVDRARGILCQLLKALPPAEREKHLARHLTDIQSWTDAVMGVLGTERAPASLRGRPSMEPPDTAQGDAPYVSDASTVPGAVRAVLTGEADGLSTRAIVAGVLLLRPSTSDASVHGALHQMRKRGELSRAGFHKNYKYVLVTSADAATAANSGEGGETH